MLSCQTNQLAILPDGIYHSTCNNKIKVQIFNQENDEVSF